MTFLRSKKNLTKYKNNFFLEYIKIHFSIVVELFYHEIFLFEIFKIKNAIPINYKICQDNREKIKYFSFVYHDQSIPIR